METNIYEKDSMKFIMSQMTESNWKNHNSENKYLIMKTFILTYRELAEDDYLDVNMKKSLENNSFFSFDKNKIFVDDEVFTNDKFLMDSIFNYFLNYKLHKISEDIRVKKIRDEKLTQEEQLYDLNYLKSIFGDWDNYASLNNSLFIHQPVGKAAYSYATKQTNQFVKTMIKTYGFDKQIEDYIVDVMLDDDDLEKEKIYIEIMNRNVEKYEKEIELAEMGMDFLKKGVGNLKDSELFFLLSDIYNSLFTFEDNIIISNEVIKRISKTKKRPLPLLFANEEKYFFNNNLYSKETWAESKVNLLVEAVVENDIKDFSTIESSIKNKDFLNELQLNLAQNDEGEYINRYDKKKDLYKYFIQPLTVYKENIISKRIRKIVVKGNEVCKYPEYYSHTSNTYNSFIDIKKAEFITQKPFEILYNELIEEMAVKANNYKNKKSMVSTK